MGAQTWDAKLRKTLKNCASGCSKLSHHSPFIAFHSDNAYIPTYGFINNHGFINVIIHSIHNLMARSIHSSCPPSCWDHRHADACDRDLGDGELLIHPQGPLKCHDLWLMAPLMLQIDSSMAPLTVGGTYYDLLWLTIRFTDLFEHFLTVSLMIMTMVNRLGRPHDNIRDGWDILNLLH